MTYYLFSLLWLIGKTFKKGKAFSYDFLSISIQNRDILSHSGKWKYQKNLSSQDWVVTDIDMNFIPFMAKWIYKWYNLILAKLVVIVITQCQLSGFWIMSGMEANLWVWLRTFLERINWWQWQHLMDWTKGQRERPSSGLSSPSPASAHREVKNLLCHKLYSVLLYCVWLGNHGLNLETPSQCFFPPDILSTRDLLTVIQKSLGSSSL